jgi:hypothetical protein
MLEETVFGDKGIPIASDRINYLKQLTLSEYYSVDGDFNTNQIWILDPLLF